MRVPQDGYMRELEMIAEALEKPLAEIRHIVGIAERFAPDYDEEQVCEALLEVANFIE